MRIAVVTETYPPEVNGVALTVHALVAQMAADGHQLTLVRPHQPGVSAPPLPQPIEEVLVAGAARRLGIPVATGFHTHFDAYAGAYGLGPLTGLVRRWLRRMHNASGATIVPTTELREWLEQHGFERVRVLARGVDTQLFDPARRDAKLRARWGLGPDGLAVTYVGRIAAEKNLALAVDRFDEIRKNRPDARFVWVGTGPTAERLRRERPDFVFTGLRLGEDLAAHFASADLFLFPSLTETFGNVTLEAMASGVPTVAFDYGAAHAHLRDRVHGRIVACGDDAGFAAAAVDVAMDPAGRQRMGAASRQVALVLSPEQVARDFVGLLADIPAGAAA